MNSLQLSKADLQVQLGLYLGWGRGAANGDEAWDDTRAALLKSFVDSGYSRFLNSPPIEGVSPGGHDWTFLKPVMTMLVPAGSSSMPLPEDFGNFASQPTIKSTTGSGREIKVGHEMTIRTERQKFPGRVGRPFLVAVNPIKGTQRLQLELYPTTDLEYTLQACYTLVPNALTDASPYAYGGAVHRETLLESCLAVAEERWDKIQNGVHAQAFMKCLAASIKQDRKNRPQWYGYDGDNSDRKYDEYRDFPSVKFHGSEIG